jgi:hypothetical protein
MDQAIINPAFSTKEAKLINYCKLYLQVTTISNICTADGASVDETLQAGSLESTSSTSAWLHFNQGCPLTKSWILGHQVLTIWFDLEGILYEPLGAWLHLANQLCCNWRTMYLDSSDNCLYVCLKATLNGNFHRYSQDPRVPNTFDDGKVMDWTQNHHLKAQLFNVTEII